LAARVIFADDLRNNRGEKKRLHPQPFFIDTNLITEQPGPEQIGLSGPGSPSGGLISQGFSGEGAEILRKNTTYL